MKTQEIKHTPGPWVWCDSCDAEANARGSFYRHATDGIFSLSLCEDCWGEMACEVGIDVDKDTFKPEVLGAMLDWVSEQRKGDNGENVRVIR